MNEVRDRPVQSDATQEGDNELTPLDRAVIEEWERRGFLAPVSDEERLERLNRATDILRKSRERVE